MKRELGQWPGQGIPFSRGWEDREGPPQKIRQKPIIKVRDEVLSPQHYTWQIHHMKIQRNKTAPDNCRAWKYVQCHLKLSEINFPGSLFKWKVGYIIKRNKTLTDGLLCDQRRLPFEVLAYLNFSISQRFLCLQPFPLAVEPQAVFQALIFLQNGSLRHRFLDSSILNTCL